MPITLEEVELGIVRGALDTLACIVSQYNHPWDEGERAVYEEAAKLLGGTPPPFKDWTAPGDEWKEG